MDSPVIKSGLRQAFFAWDISKAALYISVLGLLTTDEVTIMSNYYIAKRYRNPKLLLSFGLSLCVRYECPMLKDCKPPQRSKSHRKWSGTRIRISGLIWIWISARSLPKWNVVDSFSRWRQLSRQVLFLKMDRWLWEMLINFLKSHIPQWWVKWKSDPESVSGTGSPPKVNQFI